MGPPVGGAEEVHQQNVPGYRLQHQGDQTLTRRSVLLKTLGNGYWMEEANWMIEDFFYYMDAIDTIAPSEKENTIVELCTTDTTEAKL